MLALVALAGCGPEEEQPLLDDALAACLPEPYRDTCVAGLWIDLFQTCLDGRGSCTWSESQDAGRIESRFDWENGASWVSWAETDRSGADIQTAKGERCMLSRIDTRCWRFAGPERWYEYCAEVDESGPTVVATHYTCDDGSKLTVRADQLISIPPMCTSPIEALTSFDDCTDAAGRRYGDLTKAGIPPCQGDACGNISSFCTDAMPCDDGLMCRSTNSDPSVTIGYCTLPCEDQPCPAGTRCTPTQDPRSGSTMRLCHQECTGPADCDPLGRQCMGATDMRTGICL